MFDSFLFSSDVSPLIAKLIILFGKGIVVLSATWIIAYMLRGSAAAIRFTVWCAGLLSLMMLPLLSSILPAWQLELLPDTTISQSVPPGFTEAPAGTDNFAVQAPVAPAPIAPAPRATSPLDPVVSATNASPSFFASMDYHWTSWAFMIWLLGVFVASVRLMLAHAGAMLLVRKSTLVEDEDWHLMSEEITKKLGIDGFVRLRTSSWTSVPMSVGVWRPVVVLPENANEWNESQRSTVLYHELAHVKRRDCLLHLLTQITCALYWFNPLVWVASWQLRVERERACDDLVLTSGVDASSYAETLLQTARQIKNAEWSTLATVSMARQSQLEGRLLSILDPLRRRQLNKASVAVSVFMIACIVVPLAVMQPANAQVAPPENTAVIAVAPLPPKAPATAQPAFPGIVVPEIVVPEITIADIVIPEIVVPEIAFPDGFAQAEPHLVFPGARNDNQNDSQASDNVSLDSLSIDQIIQLRKYGIDADFIQSIKAMGYKDVSYRTLVNLGKYGANERYIRGMKDAGYTEQSLADYAEMSKYGVNADFVETMRDAGYKSLSAHDLVRMSKYGVNTGMIETLAKYGYSDASIDELVMASKYGLRTDLIEALDDADIKDLSLSELANMSKYGVSGRLIDMLAENGYTNLSADELTSASKYGVREDLIVSLNAAGYDLSLYELVSAGKYGVSGDLIKSMKNYGYTDLSADELISASKYGVSGRFIESLARYGYKGIPLNDVISMKKYGVDGRYLEGMSETGLDFDIDELISMRKYGVDANFVERLKEAGLEDVSVDQLIDMKKHGVDADFIRSLRDN